MRRRTLVLSSLESRLGLVLGVLCGLGSVALYGTEAGLLGALVGYFLGKLLQSTLWTVRG